MAADKTFDIQIEMRATDPDGNPVTSASATWNGMRYEGLVLVERVLIDAMSTMNDAGIAKAKLKGQGQLFEAIDGGK